jgi:hypothetical protein
MKYVNTVVVLGIASILLLGCSNESDDLETAAMQTKAAIEECEALGDIEAVGCSMSAMNEFLVGQCGSEGADALEKLIKAQFERAMQQAMDDSLGDLTPEEMTAIVGDCVANLLPKLEELDL